MSEPSLTPEQRQLRQRIAQLEAERDRLDCTRREGGDTRHCRVDAKCLRCRLEAEHIPREDRERALEVAAQWGSIPSPDIGGPNFIGTEPRKARLRAEARRLLKLED